MSLCTAASANSSQPLGRSLGSAAAPAPTAAGGATAGRTRPQGSTCSHISPEHHVGRRSGRLVSVRRALANERHEYWFEQLHPHRPQRQCGALRAVWRPPPRRIPKTTPRKETARLMAILAPPSPPAPPAPSVRQCNRKQKGGRTHAMAPPGDVPDASRRARYIPRTMTSAVKLLKMGSVGCRGAPTPPPAARADARHVMRGLAG